jgi:hypothetical protein
MVVQPVKTFATFMQPSLQEPTTGLCLKSDESNLHLHIPFLLIFPKQSLPSITVTNDLCPVMKEIYILQFSVCVAVLLTLFH